jgi:hypothetical protein
MDPITTAILAAITAGVVPGLTQVSKKAIVDAYDGLKALLEEKFGKDSDIAKAVEELENKPDSTARRAVLQEEVRSADAEHDPALLQSAEALLAKIKDCPGGQTIVTQLVTGDRNIFSGTGNVTVTNQPKD